MDEQRKIEEARVNRIAYLIGIQQDSLVVLRLIFKSIEYDDFWSRRRFKKRTGCN